MTTSVETEIPETATRVFFLYKLNSAFARGADPTHSSLDSRFDLQVNQALPFMPFGSTRWEVLVGVRNLFRDPMDAGSIYDELLVVHAAQARDRRRARQVLSQAIALRRRPGALSGASAPRSDGMRGRRGEAPERECGRWLRTDAIRGLSCAQNLVVQVLESYVRWVGKGSAPPPLTTDKCLQFQEFR